MTTSTPANAPASITAGAALRTAVGSTAPRPVASTITGRQTLLRSIAAEWVKFWTLRSTWITSFVAVALIVLFSAGTAIGFAQSEKYLEVGKLMITFGLTFGRIVVAVLGALIITGEYASGQIRSSLAAVPRRGRLLLSKAVVLSVVAFLLGSGSVLLSWAISKPFLGEYAGSLTDWDYSAYILGSGLDCVGIALMALGIGFLLRSTAGAITMIVSLLFVADLPLQMMSQKWEWAGKLMECLPRSVAAALSDLSINWSDGAHFLTQGQAIAIFAAWAIIPVIAAWLVFSRRDA
jgi:putative integral membrane transport protein